MIRHLVEDLFGSWSEQSDNAVVRWPGDEAINKILSLCVLLLAFYHQLAAIANKCSYKTRTCYQVQMGMVSKNTRNIYGS